MSRITSGECFCMDMEWYGVDKQGNIAVFCSAGEGYLPEFVCEDRERAEQVARDFSDKGLYYFDSDDGTRYGICALHEYYTKLSSPLEPLKYSSLPETIQDMLKYNVMEIEDFSSVDQVYVEHAYA